MSEPLTRWYVFHIRAIRTKDGRDTQWVAFFWTNKFKWIKFFNVAYCLMRFFVILFYIFIVLGDVFYMSLNHLFFSFINSISKIYVFYTPHNDGTEMFYFAKVWFWDMYVFTILSSLPTLKLNIPISYISKSF